MIQHKMKLGTELGLSLANCDEVWIAVALISDAGFAFVREHIPAGAKQHYLIGIDLPFSPAALRQLMEAESGSDFTSKVYHRASDFFHP